MTEKIEQLRGHLDRGESLEALAGYLELVSKLGSKVPLADPFMEEMLRFYGAATRGIADEIGQITERLIAQRIDLLHPQPEHKLYTKADVEDAIAGRQLSAAKLEELVVSVQVRRLMTLLPTR